MGAGPTNVLIGARTNDPNAAAERNIISGNNGNGIYLQSSTTTVAGNYIGIAANGASALGNIANGVLIVGGQNNTIGGTATTARNIISGNSQRGVWMIGSNSNVVAGNIVGLNAAGSSPVGNAYQGVEVAGGSGNTIGGNVAGAGNVISANGGGYAGVLMSGTSANLIAGNFIGTDATGEHIYDASGQHYLGNALGGIDVVGAPGRNVLRAGGRLAI